MEEFFDIILNGPLMIVIPLVITGGLVWVFYYFIFPIMDKNEKLIENNEKLQNTLNDEVKNISKNINEYSEIANTLTDIERDITDLVKFYPKIEDELKRTTGKISEIREFLTGSRRNIDNTAQIIGILKSLESVERSIEVIKERQITQAGVLSNISNSLNSK